MVNGSRAEVCVVFNKIYFVMALTLTKYFCIFFFSKISSVQQAVHNQTCLFGTVDTWLLWNLTGGIKNGVHCTDVTNASRTM